MSVGMRRSARSIRTGRSSIEALLHRRRKRLARSTNLVPCETEIRESLAIIQSRLPCVSSKSLLPRTIKPATESPGNRTVAERPNPIQSIFQFGAVALLDPISVIAIVNHIHIA